MYIISEDHWFLVHLILRSTGTFLNAEISNTICPYLICNLIGQSISENDYFYVF